VGLGLGLGSPSPSKSPSKQLPATQPQQQQRKASGTAKPRATSTTKPRQSISSKPPRFSVDDEFGDFGEAGDDVFEDVDFGDFVSPKVGQGGFPSPAKKEKNLLDFGDMPLPSKTGSGSRQTGFFALVPSSPIPTGEAGGAAAPGQWYHTYQRVHIELVPLCQTLRSSPSPSSTLSLLFPPDARTGLTPTLEEQGDRLLALIRFLSPTLQPLHDWGFLRQALLAAADRFDSTCLVAFEVSDTKKDQHGMQAAAEASWKVWEAGGGRRDEWECGRVWIEKREVFYDTVKWDATENIM
jgi:recyclin-1